MKCEKPQFTSLRQAAQAIQGFNSKVLVLLVDSRNIAYVETLLAYEADK